MKRALIATTITIFSIETALAVPFMTMDARGMAMGNTGVASAKLAHAPAYNPSLLSQVKINDHFALVLPQIGVRLSDEKKLVNATNTISNDILPRFENLLSTTTSTLDLDATVSAFTAAVNSYDQNNIQESIETISEQLTNLNPVTADLETVTHELTNSLSKMSGNPLSAQAAISTTVAIPSKKMAAAISISGYSNISAYANFSNNDLSVINGYASESRDYVNKANELNELLKQNPNTPSEFSAIQTLADELSAYKSNQSYSAIKGNGGLIFNNGQITEAAKTPNFDSTLHLIAMATIDVGFSFSREFDFSGEKVAIGITPKLQKISTFHYADEIDSLKKINKDTLKESQLDYNHFNLDIGASYRFGDTDQWMVGIVGKNLIGGTFDYKSVWIQPKNSAGENSGTAYLFKGGHVSIHPQFRGGVAYNSNWLNVALDLDLIENDPIGFEAPTQFAAIGFEFDVIHTMQLRAGFRTNLASSNMNIASLGVGLSPFGVHIEIGAMVNMKDPETEAGVAIETGFYF